MANDHLFWYSPLYVFRQWRVSCREAASTFHFKNSVILQATVYGLVDWLPISQAAVYGIVDWLPILQAAVYCIIDWLPKTYKKFMQLLKLLFLHTTVNLEIFMRVLFSRNFAYEKFCENKILAKWRNHSIN